MTPQFQKRSFRGRTDSSPRRREVFYRPRLEQLEDRVMLDAGLPAAIVVGRTLSSYFAGAVQNNQETITFTVYNEQANPVIGVLLTDTLQPGVAFQGASQLPDQSGQNLAWSLGTINGFDRASVTLTVSVPSPIPLQLDSGTQAFATLDAGMVSNFTPAATLWPGNFDPSLLASTADANTTDPFIQEEAAALSYNPQNIFNFLHSDIGYNSYLGSVRGARGTLWSAAGNALDVASLGVALMRASGIPAQYVQGTLSSGVAQNLILSMFPASYQTAGYIPAGTQTADPAHDPQLLAETEAHYWFQFDAGQGFQDADPLLASFVGQRYTTPQSTFAEVPDSLREKTEVTVQAEIYSQANSAFGGTGLTTTTVIDQTFNDVDLVGRPLTFGNFVSSSAQGGLAFSTVTNTYSPYLDMADEAYASGHDEVIRGQDYQETLTNFPLGSQILTGLFLQIDLSGPIGSTQDFERAIVDRIGHAARQVGGSLSISVDPSGPPLLSDFDTLTLNALPGLENPAAPLPLIDALDKQQQQISELNTSLHGDTSGAGALLRSYILGIGRLVGREFLGLSDSGTLQIESGTSVKAYFDRPRIIIASTHVNTPGAGEPGSLSVSIDLRYDHIRTLALPGQELTATYGFNVARGIMDNFAERDTVLALTPAGSQTLSVNTADVFAAAAAQSIPIIMITRGNISALATLDASSDAKTRITEAITRGDAVVIPTKNVTLNGVKTIAWYETDLNTGETTGVTKDGGHQEFAEYVLNLGFGLGFVYGVMLAINNNVYKQFGLGKETAQLKQEMDFFIGSFFGAPSIYLLARLATNPLGLFLAGFAAGYGLARGVTHFIARMDPPLPPILMSSSLPVIRDQFAISDQFPSSLPVGNTYGAMENGAINYSGQMEAAWETQSSSSVFMVQSLGAGAAQVSDAAGGILGSGALSLAAAATLPITINGNDQFDINGTGTLAFYGSAESSLGASGNWGRYAGTLTGDVSVTLTTDALTLNGQMLPRGTYTITTSSAKVAGSGSTTSPTFSGSVSLNATSGTINAGRGSGSVTVGGTSINPSNGITLTDYTGNITVAAGGGNNVDSVTLNGTALNVLTVSASPATFTTDQNTSVTFHVNVQTSLADNYTLTAQTPPGWTVSIDNNGNVTATPAPGLQRGTYPIQFIAQSTTNPDLVAQSIVNVTIKSTAFGITLNVLPDALFTVPFNGAELPTAFVASIHNNGPIAVTENLVFSNIPSGFTLLDSGTSVTIPAGQTGSVGVYLQPTSQIPAPGSQFSFNVAASDVFRDKASQTVSFTVPAVDGVTLTSNPPTVNATPGATATDSVTIMAVGNVPENVTLSSPASSGLTVGGLVNVTLQPGQSVTENVALIPDASTPLNTFLAATLTATFGPSGSPQTTALQIPVDVVVPGALAITSAVSSAGQLGENDLAARLNDLSTELTNLVLNPTSAVYKGQVLANLDALIGLLASDVYLVNLTTALTGDRAALAQATTPAGINTALAGLGNDLNSVATTLSDEIAHSLTIQLDPNQGQARPQVPVLYPIAIQNTGNQATTYDFSVSGLPAGVTALFNHPSVTLQPGQSLFGGPNGIVLTLVETGGELIPTGFTVIATAEGAPEINRSAAGSLTVRNAFVQVTSVTPSPSFTNPGGQVDVVAGVLNVTNNPLLSQAFYTVRDPGGNVVFTSTPVQVPSRSFVTFPSVDLGSFDTTGLALGSYTISVMVTDAAGNPLTNVIGQGSVVIGSPVTASLSLSYPTSFPYFPVAEPFTSTLKVDARTSFPPPLTLNGVTATDAPENSVALNGTLAYVSGTKDVSIVDVHDPANPTVLGTFGGDVLVQGGYNVCRVSGSLLLVATQNTANTNYFDLLIYSIANPLSPTLISNTLINYHFVADMFVEGTTAYIPLSGVSTFVNVILTDQFGDFLAVDFSNPAQPRLADVLFNNRGAPDGGDYQEGGASAVNGQLTYVTSTTSKGSDSQIGNGELLVVNTSDPTHLAVAGTLNIPGTVRLLNVAIHGNRALAVGSTGGSSITSGASSLKIAGNLTLTPLDISDPQNPKIIGPTFVTQDQFFTGGTAAGLKIDTVDLGNGLYAISNTQLNGNPVLLLVDTSDPNHMIVGTTQTPSAMGGMTVSGGLLYASTQDGLLIYNIGQVLGVPVTLSVEVPTGTAVTYDPASFNIAPSQIVHGAGFDTLTWVTSFGAGTSDLTITWTSHLAANQPPGTDPVTLGATVGFISQGTPGSLTLPGTYVIVTPDSFLFVSPGSQTVQPGASATYTIELSRRAPVPDTYHLSVAGLPTAWVNVPATVTQPSIFTVYVPLTIVTDPAALAGTYNFTVVATDGTFTDSYQVSLIVQGQPILPPTDPDSHGIVAALTPTQASAGQGTSATYTVQLTNTGSADDTFALAGLFPPGVSGTFSQQSVDVAPGASNFRDVTLTLTTRVGAAAGSDSFQVTATSTTKPSITTMTAGTLNVLRNGVSVALNPPSGPPGSSFQLTVTNTGQVTDTFNLALGGPAALVSQLGVSQVTLAPGAFQVVPITTGAVNFAVSGALNLAALATSQANPAVQAEATAALAIPATTGMTAAFSPASQVILVPGTGDFLLLVNDTGNTEDAYTATITGTSGPLTASLTGLTGQSAQTIPLFRLPGLSTGAILLQADLAALGQGTVTVQVQSLSDPTIVATATATLFGVSAPTASDKDVATNEGTPVAVTLTGSDPNTPAQPLTYIITAKPAHGTLGTLSGNTVTYTPSANYLGPDSFQFKVNNGAGDSNVATVSITVQQVQTQATVSSATVSWGSQTSGQLVTQSDGLRLLPAGRSTDFPWLNVQTLNIVLSTPAVLTSGDVAVTGLIGITYGVQQVIDTSGGAKTSYAIVLANPIAHADRVTFTIGNTGIATFTRRLDVLPGDVNDDGGVNTTDGVLIRGNYSAAHGYSAVYDINGDGAVNSTDFTTYRPFIGTVLPTLPPQLAAGGEGPGSAARLTADALAPVMAAAVALWASAGLPAQDVARLRSVTAQVADLPAGYLGGAPIDGNTIYLSADAAGYGWFIDPAPWSDAAFNGRLAATELSADPGTAHYGNEDLLTVVSHELGHTLGLNDVDPTQAPADLMTETLATGVRRLPSAQDVAAVLAAQAVPPPLAQANRPPASAGTVFAPGGAQSSGAALAALLNLPAAVAPTADATSDSRLAAGGLSDASQSAAGAAGQQPALSEVRPVVDPPLAAYNKRAQSPDLLDRDGEDGASGLLNGVP